MTNFEVDWVKIKEKIPPMNKKLYFYNPDKDIVVQGACFLGDWENPLNLSSAYVRADNQYDMKLSQYSHWAQMKFPTKPSKGE